MEYFPTKKEPKKEKERKPIKDYYKLLIAFEQLQEKYKFQENRIHSLITPFVFELKGEKGSKGSMREVQLAIEDTSLKRTDTGQLMLKTLRYMDELYGWQGKYIEDLDKFFDDMAYLTEGAFEIIKIVHSQNNKLREEIIKLMPPPR